MMALNTGDLSFLEGLTEVKKRLSPLGPWVMVLLHPAQEEFLSLQCSAFFSDSSQRPILTVYKSPVSHSLPQQECNVTKAKIYRFCK